VTVSPRLVPHPRILKPPRITHYQRTRKRLACRQDYRTIILYKPLVLRPKRFKGNHRIPFAGGRASAVGQVAQHHVNGFVFNVFHRFKTISIDKAIRWQLPYGYDLLYVVKSIHRFLPLLTPIYLGQYQPLPDFLTMIRTANYQVTTSRPCI
jgi:hypothetical protein